ncbi:beta-lactamase/transpeptidase-like protein [Glonium stellatum]|uniref:Beta-lactamase/transpeptidase-like protein n=1 Tax=Glonium stellatum TaxID=574774 RepID=A0A8E2JXR2_9PEZI|nr:beta-lactamase/transpeptidase-like protein [Glonium stellatum]
MASFDAIVEEATTRGSNGVPGVVLTAIDRNGNPLYTKSSGYTSLDPSAPPISPNNTFHLASCTKLITSIAALQCVSRGILSLDDPSLITTHLPELASQPILALNTGPDASSTPFLYAAPHHRITLRMLLAHTSGIGYDVLDPRLQAWRKSRNEPPLALSGGPTPAVFAIPLLFEPGQGLAYGGGLDWAGELIARVTGQSLGVYLQQHVFAPLGMRCCGFRAVGELVQVATRGKDGGLVPFVVEEGMAGEAEAEAEGGGGGLYASVKDYMALLVDLLREEPRVLGREMVALLFAPQFAEGSAALEGLRGCRDVYETMTGGLTRGLRVNHGLGGVLVMEDAINLGRTKGTLTWGGSFGLMWFVNRERGVAAMYASQMYPPGDDRTAELMRGFVKEVWSILEEREGR